MMKRCRFGGMDSGTDLKKRSGVALETVLKDLAVWSGDTKCKRARDNRRDQIR